MHVGSITTKMTYYVLLGCD